MTRRNALIAIAASSAALAVLIPPGATAAMLTRSDPARLADVATGVWLFKAMLLVHAAIAGAAARLRAHAWPSGVRFLAGSGGASGEPARASDRWLLGALLVLALVLRLIDLGRGLWFDEIATLVTYVRAPFGTIISSYPNQNQHLLYSLLAKVSVVTFGDSSWALRLPAALFGVASLWALYQFASRITSRREALLAVAVLTASYHHVWFSQNARGYTGLLFFTLVSSTLFLRLVGYRGQPTWGAVGAYAATTALALFTHPTALFVTAAHGLIWLALLVATRRDAPEGRWRALAAFALGGTLTLQLYALALPQAARALLAPTMQGVDIEWKQGGWFFSEMLRGLSNALPGGLLTIGVAVVVVAAGLVSYARQSRTVAAMLVVPGIVTGALIVALHHNLWPRFFFFCAGFAVLLAIRGGFVVVRSLVPRRAELVATIGAAAVAALSLMTVPRAWQPKQDYGGARDFVDRSRAASDAVVTVDLTTMPYRRYFHLDWPSAANAAELAAIERAHSRTWVLVTFPARVAAVAPDLWARLQDTYRTAAEFQGTVGSGTITVLVRK